MYGRVPFSRLLVRECTAIDDHRRLNKLRSALPNVVSLHSIELTLKTFKLARGFPNHCNSSYLQVHSQVKASVGNMLMANICKSTLNIFKLGYF